ncbi:molybdate ABC transporter substrate-binding protein [Arcanobacterium phocisimile]|uniref:Molybdate ABC transporter substrate-binding protein n=1 Tax=Arcanobacterium phocisimile TaxID=1302235 RepID=A0ABX7IF99_9ACTO|nr:molybdate ABC transporter substrate-binding protein [Arcanobacterium phocisimile]QRV01702.1 molybdate ABC transporter substrate-binding protein [Arcanobacterium phocisimile]
MKKQRWLVSLCVTLVLSGCLGSADLPNDTNKITIFAASSLHQALPEIVSELAPDINVSFNFDGSSSLVDQLSQGAPADLLITADENNMQKALANGLVDNTESFASNTLVLVVPNDNPGNISRFDQQSLQGKRLVICAQQVPCGTATQKLASETNVKLTPVSEEQSVTSVLGKVISGEADAGIVYKTDAIFAQEKVSSIDIENAEQIVNNYMIGVTHGTQHSALAQRFQDLILSADGQRKLAQFGFTVLTK